MKSVKASATLTPWGIVNLGISRTWQPAQLKRFRSRARERHRRPRRRGVRLGKIFGGDLLVGEPQHEGHHLFDGGRIVGPGKLRHPEAVVPRLVLLALLEIVVAARSMQLLIEEAHPALVHDLLLIEKIGAVAVALDVGGLLLIGQVFLDVSEIESGRELDSPVIERSPDRLGVFKARDRVTAEAAQPRDRLFAQIKQLFVRA